MRFLVDAQLPPSLTQILQASGHDAIHLFDVAPTDTDDALIWELAIREDRIVVTKDEDFAVRSKLSSVGPQVLWLRIGNCSNPELRAWVEPLLPSLVDALVQGDRLVIAV